MLPTISSLRGAFSAALFAGGVLLALPTEAQQARRITRTPQELLREFPKYLDPGRENSGPTVDIVHIAVNPDVYAAADLEVFLQGVERLALTAESSDIRRKAAVYLTRVGARSRSRPLPVAPIFPRLMRIYRRSTDPGVRYDVTQGMADVADRAEALAFLEQVARESPPPFRNAANAVIDALIIMGEEGRPLLRRLHESKAIQEPSARRRLNSLAERDFRYR